MKWGSSLKITAYNKKSKANRDSNNNVLSIPDSVLYLVAGVKILRQLCDLTSSNLSKDLFIFQ